MYSSIKTGKKKENVIIKKRRRRKFTGKANKGGDSKPLSQ